MEHIEDHEFERQPLISPDSPLVERLMHQIMDIADDLNENQAQYKDNYSLLGGKAGIAMFFAYLAFLDPEDEYADIASAMLDDMAGAIGSGKLGHGMSNGLAGIGFVFQHLRNCGFLDDSEDIGLADFDEFIASGLEYELNHGNWDPLHGAIGLGIYFIERYGEHGNPQHIEQVVRGLDKMAVEHEGGLVWITKGYKEAPDNYNFGLAHGIPGVVAFLAKVHRLGIARDTCRRLIEGAIQYMFSKRNADETHGIYTTSIPVGKSAPETGSRIAWCYGDLGLSFALIHAGLALDNTDWYDEGMRTARATTQREYIHSGCVDASFCHGAVGNAHLYSRLWELSKEDSFYNAAMDWLEIALQKYYQPGIFPGAYGYASYDEATQKRKYEPNFGLLEGISGIGLVYLSLISDLDPAWDAILLTNW